MTTSVGVIDYGLCNLDSMVRALQQCGGEPVLTRDPTELDRFDRLVLPGVGAFGAAMNNLRAIGMDSAIRDAVVVRHTPLLGVCLGMQLLAEAGEEGGEHSGLGLLQGRVVRLKPRSNGNERKERVPHIGWNEVRATKAGVLFDGIAEGADFYFVHSYHLQASDADVLATSPYCGSLVAAAGNGSVYAVQFHPEKSQGVGFRLLRNFLEPSVAC